MLTHYDDLCTCTWNIIETCNFSLCIPVQRYKRTYVRQSISCLGKYCWTCVYSANIELLEASWWNWMFVLDIFLHPTVNFPPTPPPPTNSSLSLLPLPLSSIPCKSCTLSTFLDQRWKKLVLHRPSLFLPVLIVRAETVPCSIGFSLICPCIYCSCANCPWIMGTYCTLIVSASTVPTSIVLG
jgi:hypothetical protein